MEIKRLDQIEPKELNSLAKDQAETFQRDRLKTHQLRNVFSAIEKMRTKAKGVKRTMKDKEDERKDVVYREIEADLILLKPKIAYAAGRQKSVRYHFFPFVEAAINAVEASENKDLAVKNFFALMESVVGYHKFFETA